MSRQPHLKAAYSREVKLTPLQLETIVKTNAYSALVEKDNVIGIQYCGEDAIKHCQKVSSHSRRRRGGGGVGWRPDRGAGCNGMTIVLAGM